ncbi:putative prophage phiRv2 integrase [Virgisporangium aliadipatigenens]|uniref:Putative prophage phiRv2 integrase n=1 Tax=Virgisporangium aliadipatigenens TaxID=741659 RepID=A0A8J3YKQ7_9ACTN|nr:site-specific integrase [Virgisporangium aliadipatigenens]GIJ47234.1 putative prophage phiRv2 integrase [Virgisporangium aliadipatigenens]
MPKKRRFGRVRKLSSGRYQARYLGPDGVDRPAPRTFNSKTDAERWLAGVETDIVKSTWRSPDLGREALDPYLTAWINHRPNLRPRTIDLYRWLNRKYLAPYLGEHLLSDITPGTVRAWRAELIAEGSAATMVAKAYRLLRAVLNTAVDDELIRRNPCRIKGAGVERAAERPTATVAQVFELAGLVPARFRALVLLAAFTSLRYGELVALRRQDFDSRRGTLTVRATLVELQDGSLHFGPPKTDAGLRTVTVPTAIRADFRAHLRDYVINEPDALIFTGAKGAPLRRSNFQRTSNWTTTVSTVGLPGFHFHDLRHTGNTLASRTGASLADLMARMGHASTRAALIYQHTTRERDKTIADALSTHITKERDRARNGHNRSRNRAQ